MKYNFKIIPEELANDIAKELGSKIEYFTTSTTFGLIEGFLVHESNPFRKSNAIIGQQYLNKLILRYLHAEDK